MVADQSITKVIGERLGNSTILKRRGTLSTRVTIAMVTLVLLSVLAVGGLTYRNVGATLLPREISRTSLELRLLRTQLAGYVRGAREDVYGVYGAAAIKGIIRAHVAGGIDPLDNVSEAVWRRRLADRFAAELAAKPAYDKFRLVGFDDGRELVRVDRYGDNGTIRIVPDNQLLSKSDRDYFKAALAATDDDLCLACRPQAQSRR